MSQQTGQLPLFSLCGVIVYLENQSFDQIIFFCIPSNLEFWQVYFFEHTFPLIILFFLILDLRSHLALDDTLAWTIIFWSFFNFMTGIIKPSLEFGHWGYRTPIFFPSHELVLFHFMSVNGLRRFLWRERVGYCLQPVIICIDAVSLKNVPKVGIRVVVGNHLFQ